MSRYLRNSCQTSNQIDKFEVMFVYVLWGSGVFLPASFARCVLRLLLVILLLDRFACRKVRTRRD